MRKKKTKSGITFVYTGDLKEAIDKARAELEEKQGSRKQEFLTWQFQKAKKELETFNQRIADLTDFITLGEQELRKKSAEGEAQA